MYTDTTPCVVYISDKLVGTYIFKKEPVVRFNIIASAEVNGHIEVRELESRGQCVNKL